jgi:hypothetical protein
METGGVAALLNRQAWNRCSRPTPGFGTLLGAPSVWDLFYVAHRYDAAIWQSNV